MQSDLEEERQQRLKSDRYCLELESKMQWRKQITTNETSPSPAHPMVVESNTASTFPSTSMEDPSNHHLSEVSSLQQDLSQRIQENESLEEELTSLKMKLETTQEENTKLRNELDAFDLEFFEELEDLKYQCHEGQKSLVLD